MKSENRVPSIQDSALRLGTQHFGGGVVMKQLFSILLVVAVVVVAAIAHAQQPKKVPRIGSLTALNPATESDRTEPIKLTLRKRGYVKGRNIVIETHMRRESSIGTPSLPPSWSVSTLIYRDSRRRPVDPGGQECKQDDSHRYGGQWD